jgi:hypothetical protein
MAPSRAAKPEKQWLDQQHDQNYCKMIEATVAALKL